MLALVRCSSPWLRGRRCFHHQRISEFTFPVLTRRSISSPSPSSNVQLVKIDKLPLDETMARWVERPIENRLVHEGFLIGLLETVEHKEIIGVEAPASGMLMPLNEEEPPKEMVTLGDIVGSIDTDQSDDALLFKHLESNNGKLSAEFIKSLVNRDNNYDRVLAISRVLREKFPEHHGIALKILQGIRERREDPLLKAQVDSDIGILYERMGDLESALTYLQRAVDTRKHQSIEASSKVRYATKYKYKEDDEEEMKKMRERTEKLRLMEDIFTLAGVKHSLGDLLGAQADLEHCLQLQIKDLDDDDTQMADTYYNIAAIAWERGLVQTAADNYGFALYSYEKKWPEGNEDVANARHMMAIVTQLQGNWQLAETHIQKAILVRQAVLGENHPDTALAHITYGHLLAEMGKTYTIKCLAEFRTAYEIQVENFGEHHAIPAETMGKAGSVCYAEGEYGEAIKFFTKVVETYETLGDHNDVLASLYNNIGAAYCQQDDLEMSRQFHQKAYNLIVEQQKKQAGEDSSSSQLLATTLTCIGNLHKRDHKFHEALYEYHRAHELLIRGLGPEHVDVASSWSNMGQLHALQKNYGPALEHYEFALETFRVNLKEGEESPLTASCHYNIGLVHYEKSDFPRAREALQQARDIWASTLGGEHPQTSAVDEVLSLLPPAS